MRVSSEVQVVQAIDDIVEDSFKMGCLAGHTYIGLLLQDALQGALCMSLCVSVGCVCRWAVCVGGPLAVCVPCCP